MPWDYENLVSKVRNDPLGTAFLNRLAANSDALVRAFRAEHKADGNHNATEVTRVVGAINVGGASVTACQGGRVTLAGGWNPAPGTQILTLTAGYGLGENVAVMTNVRGAAAASKPSS